jgi:hypothetical protein
MKLLTIVLLLNLGLNLSIALVSKVDKATYLHSQFSNCESLR